MLADLEKLHKAYPQVLGAACNGTEILFKGSPVELPCTDVPVLALEPAATPEPTAAQEPTAAPEPTTVAPEMDAAAMHAYHVQYIMSMGR